MNWKSGMLIEPKIFGTRLSGSSIVRFRSWNRPEAQLRSGAKCRCCSASTMSDRLMANRMPGLGSVKFSPVRSKLGRPGSDGIVMSGNCTDSAAMSLYRASRPVRLNEPIEGSEMFLRTSNALRFGRLGSLNDGSAAWSCANRPARASIAPRFSDGRFRLSDGRLKPSAQVFQLKFGIDGSVMPLNEIDGKVRPLKMDGSVRLGNEKVRSGMLGSVGSENSDAKLGMPKLTVGSVRSKLIVGSVMSNRSNRPIVAVRPMPKVLPVNVSDWPEFGIASPPAPSAWPLASRLSW